MSRTTNERLVLRQGGTAGSGERKRAKGFTFIPLEVGNVPDMAGDQEEGGGIERCEGPFEAGSNGSSE